MKIAAFLDQYALAVSALGAIGLLMLLQLVVADVVSIRRRQVPGAPVPADHSDSLFRVTRTVANTNESIAVFLVAWLYAVFSGASPALAGYAAWAYVAARVVYALCYYGNRPTLRSISFGLALLSIAALLLVGALRPQSSDSRISPADVAMPKHLQHPYLFHLVQADLWQAAVDTDELYYPPTYSQDGFTHATANPDLLLNVANHFYTDVPGRWLCLRMTVDSLKASGVSVVFEGTAPVGDKAPDFPGTEDELFPHVMGGIHPSAVLEVHEVARTPDGTFLSVSGVTAEPQ